jgi:predicted PurR-regulated permease PerM
MSGERRIIYWAVGLAAFTAVLYALSAVLLPFVAGAAIAYLLDPVTDILEKWRLPRWVGAALITFGCALVVIAGILLLIPLLQTQLLEFAARVPQYTDLVRGHALRLLEFLQARLSAAEMDQLRVQIGAFASQDAIAWLGRALAGLWGGGAALLNLLSLAVITPIVTFYLLRDWDLLVARIDGWLPRRSADTIRAQVRLIDRSLSGFVRGQLTVCLMLGVFYAIGLTIVGLEFGLVIGLATGLVSFVPYFGMLAGFVVGIGVAVAQFGDWLPVALVAAVFMVGQFVEGNFVTPRVVGNRVGLHPVWLIFALLAGGTLFGFTGLLLAVPAAAVFGVLVRFAIERYLASAAYGGGPGPPDSGSGTA